jgi:hypothetical protein
MTDIVERLRQPTVKGFFHRTEDPLRHEAAAEIERLRAEIGQLYAERHLVHTLCIRQENI